MAGASGVACGLLAVLLAVSAHVFQIFPGIGLAARLGRSGAGAGSRSIGAHG
jgi:hypothetical protein